MAIEYRGNVQLGKDGPVIGMAIDDIDAHRWRGEPTGAMPGVTESGLIPDVTLLEGEHRGKRADANLTGMDGTSTWRAAPRSPDTP